MIASCRRENVIGTYRAFQLSTIQLPEIKKVPYSHSFLQTDEFLSSKFYKRLGLQRLLSLSESALFSQSSSPQMESPRVAISGMNTLQLLSLWEQSYFENVAAPSRANEEPRVETGGEGGILLERVESMHLASRLAVGMLAYPLFRAGWIIGFLGLAVTSAVQPVLQSAITVRQETQIIPIDLPIYHPQFNGSLAISDAAAMYASGPTTISRRSAVAALIGEKSGLRYTDANITGIANFGPVKYLDVTCNITAVPGNKSNLKGWDLYNFTYRYPDAEHDSDLTQFRDVSNISVLYDGVEIWLAAKSRKYLSGKRCSIYVADLTLVNLCL
ncbi:Uncharacterized protein HZ326_25954 [Fusarium oxysporum f. sp. albedinis]|nr:Uncharacterized protein HZ326_25954 [Fusarium oxysporum f. sp. albedinis]